MNGQTARSKRWDWPWLVIYLIGVLSFYSPAALWKVTATNQIASAKREPNIFHSYWPYSPFPHRPTMQHSPRFWGEIARENASHGLVQGFISSKLQQKWSNLVYLTSGRVQKRKSSKSSPQNLGEWCIVGRCGNGEFTWENSTVCNCLCHFVFPLHRHWWMRSILWRRLRPNVC